MKKNLDNISETSFPSPEIVDYSSQMRAFKQVVLMRGARLVAAAQTSLGRTYGLLIPSYSLENRRRAAMSMSLIPAA